MKPYVAQMIHYTSRGTAENVDTAGKCHAAVITQVTEDNVIDLKAFNPNGVFDFHDCLYGAEKQRGTWHFVEDHES